MLIIMLIIIMFIIVYYYAAALYVDLTCIRFLQVKTTGFGLV